jgi:hypothetical protein
MSTFAAEFAEKIHTQLRNSNIQPARWPADPGSQKSRGAVDKLKEYYKKYRTRAYESLRKAELISDPEKRRRLEDAIPFKGICEDMCPDWEMVQRMTEHDVKPEEKVPDPTGSGALMADPGRMVKKFNRSAAGQEEPLPMDVRSVSALKKSTDYLFGELLQKEEDLPGVHNYLWDRTRAVRKDFTFHSQKTPEEINGMVYCFETISRFHAVALHLLSRRGFALDSFNQKQEVEQLQNSLKTLMQVYDDSHAQGMAHKNEAEFRAYYLIVFALDPFVMEQSLGWKRRPWYRSPEVKIAERIVTSLRSFVDATGPIKEQLGSHFTSLARTNFFDLIDQKSVSYTMACVAELHFTHIRRQVLQSMVKAYSRKRDWPKDITPRVLNEALCFDTDEEAVEFAESLGLVWETKPGSAMGEAEAPTSFLSLKNKNKVLNFDKTLPQAHSVRFVESKRHPRHTLAQIFRAPIYKEEGAPNVAMNGGMGIRNTGQTIQVDQNADDMFVSDPEYDKERERQRLKEQQAQLAKRLEEQRKAIEEKQKPQQQGASPFAAGPTWTPASSTTNPPPFGMNNAPPFGAPTTPAASTPFGTANKTLNGILKSDPLANPSQPAVNPLAPPATSSTSTPPAVNPFQPSISVKPKPAQTGTTFTPPASSAPQHGGSSGFSTADKHIDPAASSASIFSSLPKQPAGNPFTTATPPTQSKTDAANSSRLLTDDQNANTTTPQSSIFSAPSTTSMPASNFLSKPAGTPAMQPPTSPATSNASVFGTSAPAKPAELAGGFMLGNHNITSPPATVGNVPEPSKAPSTNAPATPATSVFARPATTPAASVPKPPAPKIEDPMAGLTKWFVAGDGGLLGDFTEFVVAGVLEDTYTQFLEHEQARIRKEEDDASWAAAKQAMDRRLTVKYFNRWRVTARLSAHTRILREGAAKRLAYQEEVIRKEKARKKAEKKAAERKAAEREKLERDRDRNFTATADLERLILRQQLAKHTAEEELLATGIFSGMKDERSAARQAVLGQDSPYHKRTSFSPSPSYSASVDSRDMPPPKKEGWKTRSLREMFGKRRLERRSESFGSSVDTSTSIHNFRHSMPVNGDTTFVGVKPRSSEKTTNFSFSRKRSAQTSAEDPSAKKKILSGRPLHWELRARGLVLMPDGQWLPESIAIPMQEGKRYPGVGDYGLGPGRPDAITDGEDDDPTRIRKENSNPIEHQSSEDRRQSKLEALAKKFGFPPSRKRNFSYNDTSMSGSPSQMSSPGSAGKRRRLDDDVDDSRSFKKPYHPTLNGAETYSEMSADEETAARIEDTQRMLREMREMMDTLDEERPVFQNAINTDQEDVYSEDV